MKLKDVKPGEFFKVPASYGETIFLMLQPTSWPVLCEYTVAITYKIDHMRITHKEYLDISAWNNTDKVDVTLVPLEDV